MLYKKFTFAISSPDEFLYYNPLLFYFIEMANIKKSNGRIGLQCIVLNYTIWTSVDNLDYADAQPPPQV